jgi:hypothetical protein
VLRSVTRLRAANFKFDKSKDVELDIVLILLCVGVQQVSYTPPSSKFDKSKVKGIVASLVRLKDHKTATALEVGGHVALTLD